MKTQCSQKVNKLKKKIKNKITQKWCCMTSEARNSARNSSWISIWSHAFGPRGKRLPWSGHLEKPQRWTELPEESQLWDLSIKKIISDSHHLTATLRGETLGHIYLDESFLNSILKKLWKTIHGCCLEVKVAPSCLSVTQWTRIL